MRSITGSLSAMKKRWKHAGLAALSSESLQAVIDKEIPAVVISDFATLAECDQLAAAILSMKAKEYEFGKPGSYLGIPLAHYRNRPKEAYFAQVEAAERERATIVSAAFDPVERFMHRIRNQTDFNISIAEEPGSGRYFAGIIRLIPGGSDVHVDYAPTFAKGLMAVGDISAQLTWNLYVSSPSQGGETVVYDQPFEFTGIDRSYKAYDSALLVDCDSFTFQPQVGSVVIFNTGNPHVVLPSPEGAARQRIATGSFMGVMDRRNLILWS